MMPFCNLTLNLLIGALLIRLLNLMPAFPCVSNSHYLGEIYL